MRILLIEENDADIALVRRGLAESLQSIELHVIQDGEEALDFLFRRGVHLQAPTPDIILLALQLPQRTGVEILGELEHDPDLKFIPVVVLSGSAQQAEAPRCYELGANAYVVKPSDPEQFVNFVKSALAFWRGCQFRELSKKKSRAGAEPSSLYSPGFSRQRL